MKRFILFIFSIFLTFCFANAQNFSQWTNSIQYSVNSLDTVTDAVISIKIGFDSNMNTDYSDLRFEDGSYNSLPYWIEYYDIDTVKVWLKCNLFIAGINSVTAYYGNSLAISESNGDSVFVLFDDFTSSTLDAAKWTSTIQSGASYNITGGELVMNVTQTDNFVSIDSYNQYDLSEGYSFITRARTQTNRGHIYVGYGDGNSLERVNYGGYNLQNGFGITQGHDGPWSGLSVLNSLLGTNIIENNVTINNRFNLSKTINEIQFYSNDILKYIETDTTYFDYGNRNFYLWLNAWDGNNRTLWIDYIGLYKSIGYTAIAAVNGCTDSLACNYDSLANTDDGGCNYATTSTTNEVACNSFDWNGTTYGQSGTYSTNVGSDNNYSMSFDGSNNDINIQPSTDFIFNNGFNISFWASTERDLDSESFIYFRNNSLPNSPIIYVRHSENDVDEDFIYIRGTQSSINHPINLPEQSWFHLTINLERINLSTDFLSIYLNDTLISQSSYSSLGILDFSDYNATNSGIKIGAAPQVSWDNYQGLIDNVQVWNQSLSQPAIQQYMNCPPTGSEVGLVGYWNFEEGSGNTALDLTSNGNDGTINGASYNMNVPNQSCALTNANGCDSTAVLNLTINQGDTSYTSITACDSIVWNGIIYDSSGTYVYSSVSTGNVATISGYDYIGSLGNSNYYLNQH